MITLTSSNGSDTLTGDDEDDGFVVARFDQIRDPNPEPGTIARLIYVPDENPDTYIGGGGVDRISLISSGDPEAGGYVVDLQAAPAAMATASKGSRTSPGRSSRTG